MVIFALAAGLFLYIAMTDLLPELSPDASHHHDHDFEEEDAEEETRQRSASVVTLAPKASTTAKSIKRLLLADLGLIVGYSMTVILAVFQDEIVITVGENSATTTAITTTIANYVNSLS